MEKIRKFALVVVDDFDNEIDRFNLDYAETPKNLGFELQFTTLESRLTTYFTSAREKKIATNLTLNFIPPYAYEKANAFKQFVQKYMNSRTVFEYDDTTSIKNWEGKVQKFDLDELKDWGGLTCSLSFIPGTPKYLKKDNTISIIQSSIGKSYPFKYPYSYGKSLTENNRINNSYFDEIPLRITLHGSVSNPQLSLLDEETDESYSNLRFENLFLEEGEKLIIDAIQSKILLYRNGKYTSAYDYVSKQAGFDSFLYAKGNTTSKLLMSFSPTDSGYLLASYRQYLL